MKVYEPACAQKSVIRVARDFVDDLCIHNDFDSARDVIEKTLLPAVQAVNVCFLGGGGSHPVCGRPRAFGKV